MTLDPASCRDGRCLGETVTASTGEQARETRHPQGAWEILKPVGGGEARSEGWGRGWGPGSPAHPAAAAALGDSSPQRSRGQHLHGGAHSTLATSWLPRQPHRKRVLLTSSPRSGAALTLLRHADVMRLRWRHHVTRGRPCQEGDGRGKGKAAGVKDEPGTLHSRAAGCLRCACCPLLTACYLHPATQGHGDPAGLNCGASPAGEGGLGGQLSGAPCPAPWEETPLLRERKQVPFLQLPGTCWGLSSPASHQGSSLEDSALSR
ncbi:uncharacterized protein LOC115297777 [Suricata suricatta]|uniref:uncharacterized protein LOC115297777 n=1 Tax=Suricata suricatta TaxID=37032 RepID=UPI0011556635|nr:uncharacterized protein LOC115297777 [Suricata suricatta]